MTTITIDLHHQNVTLEELLARLQEDKELAILLTRDGEPLARLTPTNERVLGLHEGQGWIAEDFDAPLDDDFWLSGNP